MEGKLVGVDAQAGVIKVAGHYDITINMEDLTYTISKTPAVMYVPNQFGWDKHGILYSTDYENLGSCRYRSHLRIQVHDRRRSVDRK